MGSSAAAAAAAAAAADSAQWLSVKEETIFLHDGLIRVTDLAELPSEILGAPEAADTDLEVSEAAPPRTASAVRLAHPPGTPSVGLSPLRLTPTPRPPKAAPAGVCGRGGGQVGARGRRSADRPPPALPRSLTPAGDFICGFILNDPTPGILLDCHPAGPSRPGGATAASPSLSAFPQGPPTHFQGTPRLLSFGDVFILTLYTSPRFFPQFCIFFFPGEGSGSCRSAMGNPATSVCHASD